MQKIPATLIPGDGIGPEIVDATGVSDIEEGCLSLPGIYADVARAAWVIVQAQDRTGAPVIPQRAIFSSKWEITPVPGIVTMLSPRDKTHASES